MNARWIPNAISVTRMLLVLPAAWSIVRRQDEAALTLIIIAGVSDALDGLLAKRFGWVTRAGAILDPLADKLFVAGSFLAATWAGLVPAWITGIVIARDVVIVAGAAFYHWQTGDFRPQPSVLSKVNTFLQLLLVLAAVIQHYLHTVPRGVLPALVVAVALSTLTSGVDYFFRWGWRLARASHRKTA